jgi:solute carrier family 35 protein F5
LVSLSDSTSNTPVLTPSAHATGSGAALGDFLALASALCYAAYVTLLKVKIKSESRIDMQLFFGFVGLVNIVACWPIGLLLHITGFEVFELPPSQKAWQAIMVNVSYSLFLAIKEINEHPLVRW